MEDIGDIEIPDDISALDQITAHMVGAQSAYLKIVGWCDKHQKMEERPKGMPAMRFIFTHVEQGPDPVEDVAICVPLGAALMLHNQLGLALMRSAALLIAQEGWTPEEIAEDLGAYSHSVLHEMLDDEDEDEDEDDAHS